MMMNSASLHAVTTQKDCHLKPHGLYSSPDIVRVNKIECEMGGACSMRNAYEMLP
jgi:hypothetical protein